MSILVSPLLADFHHGFGTRHAGLTQDEMVSLKQIHSGLVFRADGAAGCLGEGDALISAVHGVPVSIRTADCLPILLADRRTGVVAAVHAGWRGTDARIVVNAIERMTAEFASEPAHLVAAIGPGIGECCYEVGAEVAARFGRQGTCHIDLAEENRRQMQTAGIPAAHIDILKICTRCDGERFYSYRREGERAGRMISFIQARSRN